MKLISKGNIWRGREMETKESILLYLLRRHQQLVSWRWRLQSSLKILLTPCHLKTRLQRKKFQSVKKLFCSNTSSSRRRLIWVTEIHRHVRSLGLFHEPELCALNKLCFNLLKFLFSHRKNKTVWFWIEIYINWKVFRLDKLKSLSLTL